MKYYQNDKLRRRLLELLMLFFQPKHCKLIVKLINYYLSSDCVVTCDK